MSKFARTVFLLTLSSVLVCVFSFGMAGCASKPVDEKPFAKQKVEQSEAESKATSGKKTYSDIPTPFPNLYSHDPESCWLNVYDEEQVIGYVDAYSHIGEAMTVEGDVDSVEYASWMDGAPYLINMGGGSYASDGFTVMITEKDIAGFDQYTLRNFVEWSQSDQPMTVKLRVSGTIDAPDGHLQIIASEGSQVATLTDYGWFTLMSDDATEDLMDAKYQ